MLHKVKHGPLSTKITDDVHLTKKFQAIPPRGLFLEIFSHLISCNFIK